MNFHYSTVHTEATHSMHRNIMIITVIILLIGASVIIVFYKNEELEKELLFNFEFSKSDSITFNLPSIDEPFQPCYQIENSTQVSCIPNVICPGFMKSGTTFLYYSLVHHPKIARTHVKEINFFLNETIGGFDEGVHHYSSHFVRAASSQIVVDFSPKYFMRVESAEYIYKTNRNAKFIVILRDPVDRTYSHFWFQKKLEQQKHVEEIKQSECPNRIEDINFKQYLTEEYQLLNDCDMMPWNTKKPSWNETIPNNCKSWQCVDNDKNIKESCSSCFPLNDKGVHLTNDIGTGYITHSIYTTKIEHYLKYFPLENFLFIRFEDLIEKGEIYVLNEIARWLEIEELGEEEWGDLNIYNNNDYPPMNEDEEQFLVDFFREPNERLYKLIGKDFGWRR